MSMAEFFKGIVGDSATHQYRSYHYFREVDDWESCDHMEFKKIESWNVEFVKNRSQEKGVAG